MFSQIHKKIIYFISQIYFFHYLLLLNIEYFQKIIINH